MSYAEIPVRISKSQARKAHKGRPVQLAYNQLSGDHNIKLMLRPENVRKIQRAIRNQKGCRVILSPDEIDGSGLFDWLKSAGEWIKKNVIDTPFYQKNVRPIAKELVKSGVNMLPPGVSNVAQTGADWLGDKTGAFGMRGKGRVGLKSDRSDFLHPSHPTFDSKPPVTPPGLPSKGGSFRLQGRGKKSPCCPTCGGSFRI